MSDRPPVAAITPAAADPVPDTLHTCLCLCRNSLGHSALTARTAARGLLMCRGTISPSIGPAGHCMGAPRRPPVAPGPAAHACTHTYQHACISAPLWSTHVAGSAAETTAPSRRCLPGHGRLRYHPCAMCTAAAALRSPDSNVHLADMIVSQGRRRRQCGGAAGCRTSRARQQPGSEVRRAPSARVSGRTGPGTSPLRP